MTEPSDQLPSYTAASARPTPSPALGICVLLILAFPAIALLAARTKCATFDEPYHAVAAWVQRTRGDYRMDPEDGPLFHALASIATDTDSLRADFTDPRFAAISTDRQQQWPWLLRTLYHTRGNNADAFLLRQRAAMLAAGVLLAILLCRWAWAIGGAWAAVIAATLLCLDPNFLAHAALVKNDVLFSLMLLVFAMALWRFGQRATLWRFLILAVLLPIALAIKFSALLLVPILLVLLMLRVMLPWPWRGAGRVGSSLIGRAMLATGAVTVIAVVTCAGVWAAYGFRFAPTENSDLMLNFDRIVAMTRQAEIVRQNHHPERPQPSAAELAAYQPSPPLRAAQWLEQRRLLPQSFIVGGLYTYQSTLLRDGYLLQRVSIYGRWDYYPFAMAFKTPLATLVGAAMALILALGLLLGGPGLSASGFWTALCLLVPAAIYLASAMASAMNIGIRHVLPVYPFLYLMMAAIAAAAGRRWPRVQRYGGGVALALGLALGVESLSAYPDFIPFFNVAAGGSRGGLKLLGDSNLDWGQDLPLLAAWQKQHPTARLYLSYFGQADPAYYGIRYVNLPGGYRQGPAPQWPGEPGYIAISATYLQSLWLPPELYRRFYAQFWNFEPAEVLGGSIYVYEFPPRNINRTAEAGSAAR